MLSKGISSSKIIAFAKPKGLITNKNSLSLHKRNHSTVTASDIELKTKVLRAKTTSRKKFEEKTRVIVSANKCLEDVISYAYDRMANGDIQPSVGDALKAIELQAKLKETGMLESSIINFMLEFTREGAPKEPIDITETARITEQISEPISGFSNAVTTASDCVPIPSVQNFPIHQLAQESV
jgi:hypothetical protein